MATKIDIFSGFLGAGKTTLIKKLLKEALNDTKTVLIENEFGEIGVDGGFLKEAGIEIKEMNSGCICCSLVGDFGTSLKEVLATYSPDRILIEPSGVGKLSDVMKAVADATENDDVELNSAVAVVDASKAKMYIKNFGEFFVNQIEHAGTIILSRTGNMSEEKIKIAVDLVREHNEKATLITTPWDDLEGKAILEAIEGAKDLEKELMEEVKAMKEEHHHHHHEDGECCCGHHHDHDHEHEHHHDHDHDHEHENHHDHEHEHEHEHHYDENGVCSCGHHHDHDEHDHDHEHDHHHHDHDHEYEHHHDHDHEHHHHDHDEHEHHPHDHEHEHHYDENGVCSCGHHHDHDHHHHHADDVFTSWGLETPATYTKAEIEHILDELDHEEEYGLILRAKGMVPSADGTWIYFDYVPEEKNIRAGKPEVTGKLCVIGSQIKEDALKELFKA